MPPFDADSFMQANVTDALSTTILSCPEGEYSAIIDTNIQFDEVASTKNPGTSFPIMRVFYVVQDAAVKTKLKREKVTVRQDIFLDLQPSGALDTSEGKNVTLGRVRAALGQNKAGQPWSPAMLKGAGPVMIQVKHRPNEKDPTSPYAEVARVSAMK